MQRHGRAIGVDVTPHALRHTCATHLLRGGADMRHVQELLGHRCLATTALYTRVAIEDLRQVLAPSAPAPVGRGTGRRGKISRALGPATTRRKRRPGGVFVGADPPGFH